MMTRKCLACVATYAIAAVLLISQMVVAQGGREGSTQPVGSATQPVLRGIRMAVFDCEVLKDVELDTGAMTDQVSVVLSGLEKLTIVNCDQIKKVADEHKMALAGLVDPASAVQLGKFLSADFVIVGRVSRIGQTHYVVLKIIDVATTVQTTVAAKAAADSGLEALLAQLKTELPPQVRRLQAPLKPVDDEVLARVRAAAKGLAGKTVLVKVSETHVNRPLGDPAAEMAVVSRLRAIGIGVLQPANPSGNWRSALMQTGRYGDTPVDFLLEGEGTSALAAEVHGMISCRARVELRLIAVPGEQITASDRGVGARADLVEDLAAKSALEDAGSAAADAVISRFASQGQTKPDKPR